MNVFKIHQEVVEKYQNYLQSFIQIKNKKIRETVEQHFKEKKFLPEPLIQFNPSFAKGKPLDHIAGVHPELKTIFGNYTLYQHQVEALEKGLNGESFIVTSGTGSGKSLTFLGTIFNDILQKNTTKKGVKAILVYPMNALINSQEEEIMKYEVNYLKKYTSEADIKLIEGNLENGGEKPLSELLELYREKSTKEFPVTYKKYTGQETQNQKDDFLEKPTDIILTNYMMLELIMSRKKEKGLRDSFQNTLKYLVYDELHTYRGRQGADVSMLNRRLKALVQRDIICIGTSATMATGETISEVKEGIAEVAKTLFGTKFTSDQIIGEYLEYSTNVENFKREDLINELGKSFNQDINKIKSLRKDEVTVEVDNFINNSLAIWIEKNIALSDHDEVIQRGKPMTLSDIVNTLSSDLNLKSNDLPERVKQLLRWAEALNMKHVEMGERRSFLPFRFHQFISQTGNIYSTLGDDKTRYITLEDALTYEDKPLFPIMFSRHSGYEFLCVEKNYNNGMLLGRDFKNLSPKIKQDDLKGSKSLGTKRKELTPNQLVQGYILIAHDDTALDKIWNEDKLEYLPETWFKKDGRTLTNYHEHYLPKPIFFDENGEFSDDNSNLPFEGLFIPTHFTFDPTCDVMYEGQATERTKLSGIGNEGRSSATTIISYSILEALVNEKIPLQDQKVLSFTDNRQDASLQAGHFNHFYTLGQLRSAIYSAVDKYGLIDIHSIADKVCEMLGLKEKDYASKLSKISKNENRRVLSLFIFYKVIEELKLGWRYTTPNLEGAGLLSIEYGNLRDHVADEEFYKDSDWLSVYNKEDRYDFVYQILQFFRTSFAVSHRYYQDVLDMNISQIFDRLNPDTPWSIKSNTDIDLPNLLMCDIPKKKKKASVNYDSIKSIGFRSQFGKYLRRKYQEAFPEEPKLSKNNYNSELEKLFSCLINYELIDAVSLADGEVAYLMNLSIINWKKNEDSTPYTDKIRLVMHSDDSKENRPNEYFKQFYQQDFSSFPKVFKAGEHTGQIAAKDRQVVEGEFREGKLSALYCSPTMELGIDIKNLNIVHMRNVPPNPANYAQRGGRAGRGGQTALVFTYASNTSPHDRHYFKNQIDMVAGAVTAPKIDLSNEELLQTHFHSMIMMDLNFEKNHQDVRKIGHLLDVDNKEYLPVHKNIQENVKAYIENNIATVKNDFEKILDELDLKNSQIANWYREDWVEEKVNQFATSFNHSFDRWRAMFQAAQILVDKSRNVIDDHTIKDSSQEYKDAKRDQNLGEKQRNQLLGTTYNKGENEFTLYRYLAAEGFLPGYNFTRLPLRAYVGGNKSNEEGEYISRPRMIALQEFGPQSMIYHKGNKYKVNRLELPKSEIEKHKIRFSKTTGFGYLDESGKGVDNDPISNKKLDDVNPRLISMDNSATTPIEKITSFEEERQRLGYQIEHFFSWDNNKGNKIIHYQRGGENIAQFTYAPAAKLISVNTSWRTSNETKEPGFIIGNKDGIWKNKGQAEKAEEGTVERVTPFTTDTSDIIYIQPLGELISDGYDHEVTVISLMTALERGIQKVFSVEEGEIGVWTMGDKSRPNILIYEASEGSLGVLHQIIKSPTILNNVIEEAYASCFFDITTREEIPSDSGKKREDATYDDLLSYYNQMNHKKLSRQAVKQPLEMLMDGNLASSEHTLQEDRHKELLEAYDKNSYMEKKLIDYLFLNDLRLPDKAQFNMEDFYVSVDFVSQIDDHPYLIFVDGSVHDKESVKEEDKKKRQLLQNNGFTVIEWNYKEKVEDFVKKYSYVFPSLRK
ncbi:DEAD/DEAH box helicase [Flammeovirga sp. EKP202]|uniref:DEAD/DEAH box helicase n=1 Tax=Flammeovirga sp. EKP202 TaxID=2770592 RepID=UPI00165F9A04|nr:DEAD/DEAH box helicase [Flammeovirga sp. EKP202]MBD0403239.1 DEAD/DEAH box helicase [Flammeovirga sp. EKP202]